MVCRNICRQIQAGHGSYLVGLKYCSSCVVYLYHHDGTFCRQLRTRPNNKKGKERLRLRQGKMISDISKEKNVSI